MIPNHLYKYAEAKYFCDVYKFIGVGEGREITALNVCHIKNRYLDVEQWYESLDRDGQDRVIKVLESEYLLDVKRSVFFMRRC